MKETSHKRHIIGDSSVCEISKERKTTEIAGQLLPGAGDGTGD